MYFNNMEKDKQKKKMKRDALKSFLQASATQSASEGSKVETSPEKSRINGQVQQECEEVYLDESNSCVICQKELDKAKIKKCGFCNMPACAEHLRKRRRKKGKFQRICDYCQDNCIYQIYTKLEAKAEESLNVEEEIVTLKHDNFLKEVEERREKRREIAFKTMSLDQRYKQQDQRLTNQENKLMSVEHQVQSLGLNVTQLETFVTRVEASFKQNYEQDYNILSQENSRLAKELAKLEKKCLEVRSLMEKKEKEIEQAFLDWQQRQFKKKLADEERQATKKKDNCLLY